MSGSRIPESTLTDRRFLKLKIKTDRRILETSTQTPRQGRRIRNDALRTEVTSDRSSSVKCGAGSDGFGDGDEHRHGGSMGTTHANTPYDALVRLETLAMMGDSNVPVGAIRRQIAAAIHIVAQIKRMNDGSRKITHVSEVIPEVDEHGKYMIRDLFRFIQRGRNADGKIVGEMVATGLLPTFMAEIELNRLPFARDRFTPPPWYAEMLKKEEKAAA